MAMSARIRKIVTERKLKVGQNVLTSMSQQFSSRGFLTLRPPETNSTRFYSAQLMFSCVTAGAKPPQGNPLSSSCPGLFLLCCMRLALSGLSSCKLCILFIIIAFRLFDNLQRSAWNLRKCRDCIFVNDEQYSIHVIILTVTYNKYLVVVFNMAELKIDDIEQNFDAILELTGQDSYVNWDAFTKGSTEFTKTLDELAKNIAILREIQHKKFIITMKKLKGADIPDLIKTVKAKKLPREALKTILNRFKLNDGKIELIETPEALKAESKSIFDDYIGVNEAASAKAKDTVAFLNEKIKDSGLYEEPAPVKELVSTFKHTFPEDKLEAAKKAIQIQYLPGTVDTLHITTYAQIVENTYEVVKSEYKRLTEQARAKQRPLASDPAKYLEALIEYLTNTEVLILEGQKAIGAKLNISAQKIEEAEIALMERGLAQNILYIQSGLRSRVKESIPTTKDIDLKHAKEMLSFQVNLLKNKTDFFKQLFDNLEKNQENLQLVPMILALALNDMVFEQFALEEEDIMKNVTDQVIMTNTDFTDLFKDLELHIIKLMEKIGVIPEQVSQYMQNQSLPPLAAQTANLPQPNNSMLTGGVLPGSNPMELLQLQQLQQLYQMQQLQQGKK